MEPPSRNSPSSDDTQSHSNNTASALASRNQSRNQTPSETPLSSSYTLISPRSEFPFPQINRYNCENQKCRANAVVKGICQICGRKAAGSDVGTVSNARTGILNGAETSSESGTWGSTGDSSPITVASSTEQQPWPPIVSSKNPYGTKKKYRYGTTKKDRRKEVAISLSEFKHTKEGMDFHYDTLIANRDPPLIPPVVLNMSTIRNPPIYVPSFEAEWMTRDCYLDCRSWGWGPRCQQMLAPSAYSNILSLNSLSFYPSSKSHPRYHFQYSQ